MCLAIPGQLIDIETASTGTYGSVSFDGLIKRCDLSLVPDVQPGDYLIVHAGFALTRLDEDEAQATLNVMTELAASHAKENALLNQNNENGGGNSDGQGSGQRDGKHSGEPR